MQNEIPTIQKIDVSASTKLHVLHTEQISHRRKKNANRKADVIRDRRPLIDRNTQTSPIVWQYINDHSVQISHARRVDFVSTFMEVKKVEIENCD